MDFDASRRAVTEHGLVVDVTADPFNAACDFDGHNGTDDTEAIRKAIAYCQRATNFERYGSHSPLGVSPTLYFRGNSRVTDDLLFQRSMHVQGEKPGESSSGSRINQTTPNKDTFRVVPNEHGMSFSISNMVLRSMVEGTGHLVNVKRNGRATCNSQRYRSMVCATPQDQSFVIVGDDVLFDDVLFDVSAASGGAIQLGTNDPLDTATNITITRSNFHYCTVRCVLVFNVDGLLFTNNKVTQPNADARTMYVIDALNGRPVRARGINVANNIIRGGRTLLACHSTEVVSFNGNQCYDSGIGEDEWLNAITMAGECIGLTAGRNIIAGRYGRAHYYDDTSGRVRAADIAHNTLINQMPGGAVLGATMFAGNTSGTLGPNTFDGF